MDRLTTATGPRCRCGESVPRDVARVFGTDGVVPVREKCYLSNTRGGAYADTVAAIKGWRQDNGHRRVADD